MILIENWISKLKILLHLSLVITEYEIYKLYDWLLFLKINTNNFHSLIHKDNQSNVFHELVSIFINFFSWLKI